MRIFDWMGQLGALLKVSLSNILMIFLFFSDHRSRCVTFLVTKRTSKT